MRSKFSVEGSRSHTILFVKEKKAQGWLSIQGKEAKFVQGAISTPQPDQQGSLSKARSRKM
jgi:hypothetical protein